MADKYIYNNNGVKTEKEATTVSAGVGDAGKIVGLGTDGKLDMSLFPSGIGAEVQSFTASENLSAGDLVNIFDDSGTAKVRKADAATNKETHGFVKSAVSMGNSANVYFTGFNTGLTGLTAGSRLYLSDTTAGGVTSTAPTTSGHIVQYVGVAVSSTEMLCEFAEKIVLA